MDAELGVAEDGNSLQSRTQLNAITPYTQRPIPWNRFVTGVVQHKKTVLFLLLALVFLITGTAVYFSTIHDEWINIHLVPHSHDDVGWLRTPERYYEYTVKYILNNVVRELEKNPLRKFTYVETYFFWKWWNQQSLETQMSVRRLVYNGQLEFAGGGWTMSDEATPNYLPIIDQFTWGLRKLNDTFEGVGRPTVGWQIDTFGHSREYVSLLSKMGYDGLIFARIDEEERRQRRNRRDMEFIWEDRDGATAMLTSIMYKHYNPPQGFHFEKESNEGANVDLFVDRVREQAAAYQSHNVLVPMGDDFTYYDAWAWFDKMDSMIRQVQERKESGLNVNLFYSTPSQYLQALKFKTSPWPRKQGGDFFPYSSDTFSYWSGYFTSRPSLKYFERVSHNFMQMTKQLLSVVKLSRESDSALTSLREALAMILHHDGITGTAKQDVTDHYILLLHDALVQNIQPVINVFRVLSMKHARAPPPPMIEYCQRLNISDCHTSEYSATFMVTAYNPLSWPVSRSLRLSVLVNHQTFFNVRSPQGNHLPVQLVPIPLEIRNLRGRVSSAAFELVFQTEPIPPLGFSSFYITKEFLSPPLKPYISSSPHHIKMNFHKYTGRLSQVIKDNQPFSVEQDMHYYQGSSFWTGAYIFRPSDDYSYDVGGPYANYTIGQGPVVEEHYQKLGPWTSQSVRWYYGSPVVEIDWLVGPIPIDDYQGKEVIMRYSSTIKNNGVFYTDTNGRGVLKRERDKRNDWKYTAREDISGNYYPVTSHISIRDNTSQMYLINDRAQGGTSIRDGQIELMVHRRLCYDDSKGVNEPLNETEYGEGLVVRGKHWLLIGSAEDDDMQNEAKRLSIELQSEPIIFLAPLHISFEDWSLTYLTEWSNLRFPLPPSLRILTLEPWRDGLILLRMEHMYEYGSRSHLTKSVTIKLKTIFKSFEVVSFRETALGADRWLPNDEGWQHGDVDIVLEPSAIKTFLIQVRGCMLIIQRVGWHVTFQTIIQ